MNSYNRAVTRMTRSGRYDAVPGRVSFADERALVESMGTGARGLNQRVASLRRILTTVRKDAQEPVAMPNGTIVPKWLKREMAYANRSRNEARIERLSRLYPDFHDMSAVKQATVLADSNLTTVPLEQLNTYADYTAALKDKFMSDLYYFQNYLDVLSETELFDDDELGREEIERIVKKLWQDPSFLRDVFDEDADEMSIEYVYAGGAYRDTAANKRKNLKDYWMRKEVEYDAIH